MAELMDGIIIDYTYSGGLHFVVTFRDGLASYIPRPNFLYRHLDRRLNDHHVCPGAVALDSQITVRRHA